MTYNKNDTNHITEESLFSILSHPQRRKLLKLLYRERSRKFTEIANHLQISTGSIYHHLDKLKPLISQNTDDKSYRLTQQGEDIVEKYLHEERMTSKIQQIDAFTIVTNRIFYRFIERWPYTYYFLIPVILYSIILAFQIEAILLGPIILPGSEITSIQIPYFSILYVLTLFLIFSLFIRTLSNEFHLQSIIQVFSLAIILSSISMIFLYILITHFSIYIPLWLFGLLNLLSQIWFIVIIVSGSIQYQGISIPTSIIIALSLLYFGLFLNLVI